MKDSKLKVIYWVLIVYALWGVVDFSLKEMEVLELSNGTLAAVKSNYKIKKEQ